MFKDTKNVLDDVASRCMTKVEEFLFICWSVNVSQYIGYVFYKILRLVTSALVSYLDL